MKNINSDELTSALKERWEKLTQQVDFLTNAIDGGTPDKLRISRMTNGKPRYYVVTNCQEYVTKDISIARRLAQLDYYRKILPILKQERSAIERVLKTNAKVRLTMIYDKMNSNRRDLVTPIVLSEKQRKNRFLAKEYIPQPFGDKDEVHYSKNNLKVRSKSEGMIADTLDEYGIAYRYAPRTIVDGHVVYPDFVCLNARTGKEFFWEHNGMMASDGYGHHFTKKMNIYDQADIVPGENLIMTFEDDKCPLNYPTIRRNIERYLI